MKIFFAKLKCLLLQKPVVGIMNFEYDDFRKMVKLRQAAIEVLGYVGYASNTKLLQAVRLVIIPTGAAFLLPSTHKP